MTRRRRPAPRKSPRPPVIVEAFGESKNIAEWARDPRCTVDYGTLKSRLHKGADPEVAMTAPLRRGPTGRLLTAFGETKSASDWADDPRCVVSYATLLKRIKAGAAPETALTAARYDTVASPLTLTAFGETKTLREWADDKRCRVKWATLANRVQKGWDARKALTLPAQPRTSPRVLPSASRNRRHRIAGLLHEARLRAGLTQEQLAQKSGCSEATIATFESGAGSSLALRHLDAWAAALGGRLMIEWDAPTSEVRLAPRERQVLVLMAQGLESTQIGEELGVTERTVREYRKSLYEKLGAHSSGQAVAVGLVDGHITVADLRAASAGVRASG